MLKILLLLTIIIPLYTAEQNIGDPSKSITELVKLNSKIEKQIQQSEDRNESIHIYSSMFTSAKIDTDVALMYMLADLEKIKNKDILVIGNRKEGFVKALKSIDESFLLLFTHKNGIQTDQYNAYITYLARARETNRSYLHALNKLR